MDLLQGKLSFLVSSRSEYERSRKEYSFYLCWIVKL